MAEKNASVVIGSLILFISLFFLFTYAYSADKQTIAVLDFESVGAEEHLGKAVAEIMRTELIGTNHFRVVERAQINKALSEQQLQMSGVIDDKSAVEIGKLIGADSIIIGSVVKIGTSYTINSRMIDVRTGEATLGRNVSGNDLNLLTSMSHDLIQKLFGMQKKTEVSSYGVKNTVQKLKPAQSNFDTGTKLMQGTVNWGNGKAYFFNDDQFIQYDIASGRADPGYPKPIDNKTWPNLSW